MVHKLYIYIAFFIVCNIGFAQSTDQNYVKETIYANENNVSSPNSSKNIVTTTYLDGLGRTIQIIEQNASPESGKSIVTHMEYEKNIGKIKDYLPFVNSGTQFVTEGKANTINYHTNLNSYEYLGKNNPYSEVKLEKRPSPRVIETAAPGRTWAMGEGHTIKTQYNFNNSNEVKKFDVTTTWNATSESFTNSIAVNGFYPKNTLHKTIVKNENWTSGKNNTTEEFIGVDGKVILKRTYNNNVAHDTYYAYDFYGNLAFVIPPLANGVVSETVLNTLCYRYIYDKKNRLIEKKLPQKDWEYIVYDKADRIVLTGPVYSPFGNSSKGWIFSKYDDLSRVVYTGFYNASTFSSTERKNIQTTVNNQIVLNETKQGLNSTLDGVAIRYSNNVFPTTSAHLLSINYYDDYLYPNAPTAFPSIESVATIQKPKGLQTGSWIRTVTTDAERKGDLSYTLYNAKYQPLRSYNLNSLGGYIQTDNVMLFNGTLTKSITKYKKTSSDGETVITNSFTYDNQNRLLTQKQQIGSQPQETILSNVYDQLGVLVTKNVGATSGNLQKVDYKYNVRGWLNSINENLFHNNNTDYLFGFIINYNKDDFRVDSEKQYNGGISSILWQTKSDNKLRGYTFDYDNLNRLTNAQTLRSYSGPGLFRKTEHQESLSYDKNGNILSLYRTGEEPDGQLNKIDKLSYTYTENRLMKVTDEIGNPNGFKDGTNIGNDYEYDNFGNLTKDNNKNISSIKYNHLNLPTEITFDKGKILYTYDAAGAKVKKVVQPTNGLAQTTEYINGFQYLNNQLQFFPHAEGYVKPKDDGGYLYVYQYKDHLGNIRLSYADCDGDGSINPATEILEENNYYPFGLKHQGYNDIANSCRNDEAEQIKYNGKEFEDSFGLNMYEMDLRQYDPAIGRWIVQDPVVHHDFSPYSAFDNNPVYWADPSGADATQIMLDGKLVGASFSGQDAIDAFNTLTGNENSSKTFEATYQNFYEMSSLNEGSGGGNGNGGGNGQDSKRQYKYNGELYTSKEILLMDILIETIAEETSYLFAYTFVSTLDNAGLLKKGFQMSGAGSQTSFASKYLAPAFDKALKEFNVNGFKTAKFTHYRDGIPRSTTSIGRWATRWNGNISNFILAVQIANILVKANVKYQYIINGPYKY